MYINILCHLYEELFKLKELPEEFFGVLLEFSWSSLGVFEN